MMVRLIELFAGIGSQAMAMRDLRIPFEHYRAIEFDRFAMASYNAIHGTEFETQDITQIKGADLGIVDTDKYTYLMTYSFPCQDLSVAGKQGGMEKGSGTRSGLLWEVERLLHETDELPQLLLMENVPQVHSKKNMPHFESWIKSLEELGYVNYWQDLNAKDFGVAQNRNRCFMVSILNGYKTFTFPTGFELTKTMHDYLEEEDAVADKFYINNEKAKALIQKLIDNGTLPESPVGGAEKQSTYQSISHKEQKSQIASQHGQIEGSVTTDKRVQVYANYRKVESPKEPIARSLLARDYKGFGTSTETSNAVVRINDRSKSNKST